MDTVANASIKAFGQSPKADFVPPSEEPVFILTSGQLQELISQAVEKAIQPLQDEVSQLRATIATQDEKIASLEARIGLQEDNGLIQLRLIGQLRDAAKKEAQPMQKDRGEILRALIATNGGKMLAKDARQKMHLGKEQFSLLLSRLGDYIETKPFRQDKRKLVLIIKET
jgi:hypothetical protein